MEVKLTELSFKNLGPILRGLSYNGIAGLRGFYLDPPMLQNVLEHIPKELIVTLPSYEFSRIVEMYQGCVHRTGFYPALVLGEKDPSSPEGWLLGRGSCLGREVPEAEWPRAVSREPIWDRSQVVTGKVALVTGAAQGFGWEIAQGLARAGAHVIIADVNKGGAEEKAQKLPIPEREKASLGAPPSALGMQIPYHLGVEADVTREESLKTLVGTIQEQFGGIDIVVSNAGVLRAGAVTELPLSDFELVTRVNYLGFFLVTKFTASLMGMQNAAYRATFAGARPKHSDYWYYYSDIVEINSKSGLEGSNRNAAYAGSKFGGIGLVQSFALELVEHGIKVNAICPGNFFDGPLWSDPDRGLFVQYLRAGKVPGAKTVEDVRRAYESKVPMGRGCEGLDVVRCLLYLVEQRYETGQAVPVAGGQIMLR